VVTKKLMVTLVELHDHMWRNTQDVIDNSVNVLEWPSQSLSLNPITYFWRNTFLFALSIWCMESSLMWKKM